MAFAASLTTKALSVIEICRLYWPFTRLSASTIDCVKARSLVALGAIKATLIGVADDDELPCGDVDEPPPVPPPLEPHAAPITATTAAAASNRVVRIIFRPISSLLSTGLSLNLASISTLPYVR